MSLQKHRHSRAALFRPSSCGVFKAPLSQFVQYGERFESGRERHWSSPDRNSCVLSLLQYCRSARLLSSSLLTARMFPKPILFFRVPRRKSRGFCGGKQVWKYPCGAPLPISLLIPCRAPAVSVPSRLVHGPAAHIPTRSVCGPAAPLPSWFRSWPRRALVLPFRARPRQEPPPSFRGRPRRELATPHTFLLVPCTAPL